ncbi:cell division protein FtsQ [Chlamydia trachomatis]|nr:cell division protein FtsQ [Chlamydia trachomatis]
MAGSLHVSAVSALSERLREKKRHKRRVLLRKAAIAAGVLILVGAGVWLIYFSPFFRFSLSSTVIEGVDGASIVQRTDVNHVLERHTGRPLISMNMGKLAEELQEIPEVAQAEAHVRLPRTVVVKLMAQIPVVCVGTRDACTALAEDGSVLRIPDEQKAELPMLILADSEITNAQAMEVVAQARAEIDSSILAQISQYSVTSSKQLTFTLQSGAHVKWGTISESAQKNKILAVLLTEKHDLYDVSIPSAPVTRDEKH